jgi:HD-GYP domain-containing protein (c-di-GMP phosphodiesterase class II)
MKEVKTIDLAPGMVTASDIFTQNGQKIFDKGISLTPQQIMRLTFYQVSSVLVEGDASDSDATLVSKKVVTPAYSQKVKSSKQFQTFQFDHTMVTTTVKNSFTNYVEKGIVPDTKELLDSVRSLYASCKTSLELFDMLHNMRSSNDSVFCHSLNVSLICRRFGRWMKFEPEVLDTVTLCGLFHDIGKLKIPEDTLNKPGRYTDEEFELVKQHPRFGFDLLKPLPLDEHIKQAALSHHERCDGSGYPMGLRQEETDDYAMIVAIADVYDAMTAARSYRAPLCPFQVIECFEKDGLQKYKPKYILTFLSHIASTYQNNRILLNDGRSAKIVMLNEKALSKPIIQLDDGTCIDLSTQSDLHIQAIV